ncbi:MAG: Ni/Fe-hydrogenase cytochrome b subunit [Rhodocyclaceae bacterium]|jgi:Ni/Fe-hydrogenase subunit HybB-like protein|uniref:Ni/Fe-hydrogenase cytochrome b subunit n=1 Tax=Candidatus Desulfobacillus denitrificans TaxID=2608985 RepID=A0A809RVP1_9PROT|nr:Ni/Fe-hydrogenase cytochrome b subunit [Zoogloeaceae bacterium]MCQ3924096.1 Ni/Fe-hydrogenase cytochrome b subunit [Rhodocyclaceae bacterium]MCZ2174884.1 Ni/Fe-hydrogenase cytochrome b subunit [Burkholderiales bacterium]BBO20467.1 Ni/Fe-hydrogenase cytochrome b subunit [Candidatus Desulfobacillus denitrificans]GIK44460.1 MAG: Ni/Fe-hydrogenase cytochrome b subunit [Betaproteobacteria bacterium]
MANHTHAPAPLGGSLFTPFTLLLGTLSAIAGVILLYRLFYGLGAVTNLNDGYPWGIWIAYDVVVGSAFACGGYAMALLVYIFNKGQYHPLVRPALLASLFGYTLAGASVIFDLGRWWNFWHIFWPGYAQVNSVMFEVAVCISAYIVVMWIEFAPAFLEKWGLKDVRQKLNKLLFFFIALGVLLPSMHQSSLGSLLVIFGEQIHPLWQSGMLLPLIYLMTAILLGFAVVIFEATLSSTGFRRQLETPVLAPLAKLMYGLLAAYVVVRVLDLLLRGALGSAFAATWQAFWFWVEMACFVVPLATLATDRARRSAGRLFAGAVLLMLGGFLLRINGFLVGYMTGEGWHYFPSLAELMVTVGLIAFEILAYIYIVRNYPVLPAAQPATR